MASHSRPVHDLECVWLLDHSGSMGANAILQKAIQYTKEVLATLPSAVEHESPGMRVSFGCVSGGTPRWLVAKGTPVSEVTFPQVPVADESTLGGMFGLAADSVMMTDAASRPSLQIVVLFSDGYATDDWKRGIARLRIAQSPKDTRRLSVPLTEQYCEEVLGSFASPDAPAFSALSDPFALVHHVASWVGESARRQGKAI